MDTKVKTEKRNRRRKRIRAKVAGTASRPRFSVFRSSRHLHLQLIDDEKGRTLVRVDDFKIDAAGKTKTQIACELGEKLAFEAEKKKIKKVVFDRGGCAFRGRVKEVAEAARKAGLEF